MKKNKTQGKVTPEVFDQIKLLTKNGVTYKLAAKIGGVSPTTAIRVGESSSLEDYRQKVIAHRVKYRTKSRAEVQTGGEVYQPKTETNHKSDELKVLQNLTDALVNMTTTFDVMSKKLDEVLDTKRPWLNKLR